MLSAFVAFIDELTLLLPAPARRYTHSEGGLTDKDFAGAAMADRIAPRLAG